MTANKKYSLESSVMFILLAIIIVFIACYTIDVLLLTFTAILLAIFLRTLNKLIQKVVHLPDILSVSLAIGIIIILFTLITLFMTPIISEQIQDLSNDIPSAWNKLKKTLSSTLNLDSIYSLFGKTVESLFPRGKNFLLQAANLFSTTFGLIGSVVVVIVMGIFLAYDPNTYKNGLISLIPSSKKKKAEDVINSIADILKAWIIGISTFLLKLIYSSPLKHFLNFKVSFSSERINKQFENLATCLKTKSC